MYRICVMDDIKNSDSVVQLKQYGQLKVYDAWTVSCKGSSGREIHVFLNYEKVGKYTSRQAANEKIRELVSLAPDPFFGENINYLCP